MRITGTKKLLLIFLTLICALAVGVGVAFSVNSASYTHAAYAQDEAEVTHESNIGKYLVKNEDDCGMHEVDNLVPPDDVSENKVPVPNPVLRQYGTLGYAYYSDESKLGAWEYYGIPNSNRGESYGWTQYDIDWSLHVPFGQRTTIYLNPGETWTMYWRDYKVTSGCNWIVRCGEHVLDQFYSENRVEIATNWFTIDADAPSGTVYNAVAGWLDGNFYPRATFGLSGPNIYVSDWEWTITVERLPQEKPTLVNDGNVVGDTKYVTYDGTPAPISFTPDYGIGTLGWSSDSSVTMISRTDCQSITHLTLGSSVAGTHVITLFPVKGQWADGTSTRLTFKLVVGTQTTMGRGRRL